jgi:hypothetical protein
VHRKSKSKSEAAYRPAWSDTGFVYDPNYLCELAREEALSVDIDASCQSAFASKSVPTMDLCRTQDCTPQ